MEGENEEVLAAADLHALGERIAGFAARIDVAEHALIHDLQVFDRHEAWGPEGFLSCAQWLSWRTGIGPKAARDKVRVARALVELPRVDAAFGRGELSYSKVRAITRVATPHTEQDLLDIALHATASQLERLTRSYARCVEMAKASAAPSPSERRYVRRSEAFGGMVKIEMLLAPEEAAVVWDAIEAASDRGSAEPSAGSGTPQSGAELGEEASAEPSGDGAAPQSGAELGERASAEPSGDGTPNHEHDRADAIVDLAPTCKTAHAPAAAATSWSCSPSRTSSSAAPATSAGSSATARRSRWRWRGCSRATAAAST